MNPASQSNNFNTLASVAAVIAEDNIDTDVLYPGRFLTRLSKKGMSECLLYDRRFDKHGHERADFVLNQPPFKQAQILVAGKNFGCGSSRETAVWALGDYGIRCVIAESFGEIFYGNSFNNMLLPIIVSKDQNLQIMEVAQQRIKLIIDLQQQQIQLPENTIKFDIATHHKETLISGLDDISLQLKNDLDEITAFETRQRREQPWLWLDEH